MTSFPTSRPPGGERAHAHVYLPVFSEVVFFNIYKTTKGDLTEKTSLKLLTGHLQLQPWTITALCMPYFQLWTFDRLENSFKVQKCDFS